MTDQLRAVALVDGVAAAFTGRRAGNLAHRRPHRPAELAAARRAVVAALGAQVEDLHLMHQVHGAAVAVVDAATPRGTEHRAVDALVTDVPGRVLGVQVADCVPVLLAMPDGPVAAVHAGRAGVAGRVVAAAIDAMVSLGAVVADLRAAIGPAIGGCCYEVPQDLQDDVVAHDPAARATTTWGTPSLDLPSAVAHQLAAAGITHTQRVDACTRCAATENFSHRADPTSGRQLGLIVRRAA